MRILVGEIRIADQPFGMSMAIESGGRQQAFLSAREVWKPTASETILD